MLKMLVVLPNMQSQLVTVIVLLGQKVKPSQLFLLLPLMKINGLKALLKLGKLLLKMVTLVSKHQSTTVKNKLRTNMNVSSFKLERSARQMIIAHGLENQPKTQKVDSDSTVA